MKAAAGAGHLAAEHAEALGRLVHRVDAGRGHVVGGLLLQAPAGVQQGAEPRQVAGQQRLAHFERAGLDGVQASIDLGRGCACWPSALR